MLYKTSYLLNKISYILIQIQVSYCRFGVSPVNYSDPDPDMRNKISNILNKISYLLE